MGHLFFGFQLNVFVGAVHYTSKHILHRGGKERSDDINGVLGIPTDFRTLWPWLTSSFWVAFSKKVNGLNYVLVCIYLIHKKIHTCVSQHTYIYLHHYYIVPRQLHTQKTWLGQWFTIFPKCARQGGDKKVEGVTKRASRVWKIGWLYMKECSSNRNS